MPVEPLVELIDSIKYVLPALLLVIGIALDDAFFTASRRRRRRSSR